jgi:hypothetical protein
MMAYQNDIDFEEKLLLSSLNHHPLQQQPLILPDSYSSYISPQTENSDDPTFNKPHHRRDPSYNSEYNIVSITSMSTQEDMLDDFELNFEGDQPNIVDMSAKNTTDTIIDHPDVVTVVSSKSAIPKVSDHEEFLATPELPRNITMDTQQLSSATSPTKIKLSPRKQRKSSSPTRKTKQESSTRVDEPKSEDVLCGQSRVCASHPGNQTFQKVLGDFAHKYDIATSKQEKMHMTKAIVATIHDTGGRFLKYKDGMWEEISIVAARDKVSHALRTKVASWKRQSQQLLQKEKDPFAASRRTSLSRQSRKRSIRDSSGSPIPVFEQETSKFNNLLQTQQASFANLTTPTVSPDRRHHVRHSYSGAPFYQNNTHHSMNSSMNSFHHSARRSSSSSY